MISLLLGGGCNGLILPVHDPWVNVWPPRATKREIVCLRAGMVMSVKLKTPPCAAFPLGHAVHHFVFVSPKLYN